MTIKKTNLNRLRNVLVCLGIIFSFQLLPFGGAERAMGAEPYKIGNTFPFSGSLGGWGPLFSAAFQIAVDEQNSKGGIKGREVKVVLEDSKGTPEGGVAALRKLAEFDKVPVALSMMTNVVLAQLPYCDSKGVVLMTTVQSPGMAQRSRWHFVASVQVEPEIRALSAGAKGMGAKRLLSFEADNAWGRSVVDVYKKIWVDEGGGAYENVYFKYGEIDYRGLLPRVREFNPDVLTECGQGASEGGLIIKQTREAGIRTPFFVSSTEVVPFVKRAFIGVEEGIVFTDTPRGGKDYDLLCQEFKKRTGEDCWIHIPIVYTQAKMIMQAFERAGDSAEAVRAYLASLKNFPIPGGGSLSFDENKLAQPTNLTLYQFKGGKVVPYTQ